MAVSLVGEASRRRLEFTPPRELTLQLNAVTAQAVRKAWMLNTGPALRVVIHLNEDIGSRNDFLYNEILSFLYGKRVSGATVIRPDAGFGLHHRVHVKGAPGAEGRHLPIRVEFVETREKVEALLDELCELVTDGMIEAQETTILKVVGKDLRVADDGIENR
jgi:PII-like signaling protein